MTTLNGGGIGYQHVTQKISVSDTLIWDIEVNGKGLASIVPAPHVVESVAGCLVCWTSTLVQFAVRLL